MVSYHTESHGMPPPSTTLHLMPAPPPTGRSAAGISTDGSWGAAPKLCGVGWGCVVIKKLKGDIMHIDIASFIVGGLLSAVVTSMLTLILCVIANNAD